MCIYPSIQAGHSSRDEISPTFSRIFRVRFGWGVAYFQSPFDPEMVQKNTGENIIEIFTSKKDIHPRTKKHVYQQRWFGKGI